MPLTSTIQLVSATVPSMATGRAPPGNHRRPNDGKDVLPHPTSHFVAPPQPRQGYEQSVSGVSLHSEGSAQATGEADWGENPLLQYLNSSGDEEEDREGRGKPRTTAINAVESSAVYKVNYSEIILNCIYSIDLGYVCMCAGLFNG